jgi:FMN phosphatase YigB (HAD superfamily)
MIKCVIFDVGDTLIQSAKAIKEAHNALPEKEVLEKHGFFFSLRDITNAIEYMHKKAKTISQKDRHKNDLIFSDLVVEGLGLKPNKELSKELENAFIKAKDAFTKPMPFAKDILDYLKSKNILSCVITNTRTESNRKNIERFGLIDYFDIFLESHKEDSIKSELKLFHKLLKEVSSEYSIKPEECLMVGNHLGEDTAAKKAGIKTIILTKHIHSNGTDQIIEPDYYIDELIEIKDIIEGLE